MARKPRTQSKTGIHHIMLRGINKQVIFHDKEDSYKFLKILSRTKEKLDFEVKTVYLLTPEREEPLTLTATQKDDGFVVEIPENVFAAYAMIILEK